MLKNKSENKIFKRVVLNKNSLLIENGYCIVPEGVTSIGDCCFSHCSSLTSVQLPSSLLSISECAFLNTNIQSISIPEGVTLLGSDCFDRCESLTNVQLPSSLRKIESSAFLLSNISTMTIPEGVTLIWNNCFNECEVLTRIQLPASIISIGENAFYKTNISTITIPEGITKYECKVPLFVKNRFKNEGIECPNYFLDVEDIRRKEIILEDGKCIVPEGVTSLGYFYFSECQKLTRISLPSSLKRIDSEAFVCSDEENSSSIIDISIPKDVTKYECQVPLFVKNILNKKGVECPNYYLDVEDIKRGEISIDGGKYIVPKGVTSIGNNCFNGYTSLTSIHLPLSLLNIEEKAFYETGIIDVIVKGVNKFECKVPEFIKKILESKGIECPNSYHDVEDTRREMPQQIYLVSLLERTFCAILLK